ncbi:tripartite tricarboxylate transporter TctB family protein [Rhodovulum sp. P5]|uniref:tripartite tricarboxylate transporter TctB family protein n=1 Tax=Rhodovulum sp. P5 TaxID=1564506 RepID=UPI0009DAD85F|nr:tripartite tricarboxylate transporter TctB family protein [Rhodovulum sp. P5]
MSARSSRSNPGESRTSDRLIGAVVVVFALLLWRVVIPDQVDTADYGWMRPRTLPLILAAALAIGGALLVAFPTARPVTASAGPALRLGGVLVLAAAGAWAIGTFGFVASAWGVALGLSLLLGERRWAWLVGVSVAVPAAIWLTVSVLLHRPLP